MKTTLIMVASVLTFSCANAQKMNEADVPANVKNGFDKKYPGAKVEKWEKEEADYEAEFDLNKVESSAVFDASGNFKEVEQEIKKSELPKAVTDYCTKNYAGYKLSEAAKITDSNGKVMFEAEMSKGKEHFDAIFDDKGNFVKKGDPKTGEEDKD
ncbi:MAG: PepSY-like domain-containing protein [Bacteroidota bacterium]|nr:PepSY-like domain-containing protein [Bacteroidota bacterium]